jgi:hypothetical protein
MQATLIRFEGAGRLPNPKALEGMIVGTKMPAAEAAIKSRRDKGCFGFIRIL